MYITDLPGDEVGFELRMGEDIQSVELSLSLYWLEGMGKRRKGEEGGGGGGENR